jgi:nucleotide-binding universal stress UspA family protein
MFKNVLVGVDGRPSGRDAIALASRLMEPDGKLILANVHAGSLHPTHAITPGLVREERAASEKLLVQEREAAGVSAELLSIEAMSPGSGLHIQADEQRADLLVVGSTSRSAFGRAALGDDTRAALNGAPCAVAIAARGYAEHPTPITKVGVAYNRSPESEAALAAAREITAPTRADLHALEVVPIMSYAFGGMAPPVTGESVEVMLKEANGHMRDLPDVTGRAVYGLPGEELAAFGDEVDLLVAGSRGYGPLRRVILGSTCNYLERHARCSLLVLPRAAARTSAVPAGSPRAQAEAATTAA